MRLIYIALAKPDDGNDDDDDGRYMPLPKGGHGTKQKRGGDSPQSKREKSFMTSEHQIKQLSQNASVMPVIYHPPKIRNKPCRSRSGSQS